MVSEKNVLVTASSKGIGRFIAEYLHHKGYKVIGTSRNPKLYNLPYKLEYLDYTHKQTIDELARKIPPIDAAVINTGNPPCEPCLFNEADYEDWLSAAKLYIAGPLYLTRILIEKSLSSNKKLSLLFISAASIIEPMKYFPLSDTVRSGLSRAAKLITRSYSPMVRANILLLGSYDTPGARENVARIGEREGYSDPDTAWKTLVEERNPGKLIGDPVELGRIVEILLFVANYINGTVILVDGSMTRSVLI